MRYDAVFLRLALCSSCAIVKPQAGLEQLTPLEEPAFGIEFSPGYIVASFAPARFTPKEIAAVLGNDAYQKIMRSYLELCVDVRWYKNHVLPWDFYSYCWTIL